MYRIVIYIISKIKIAYKVKFIKTYNYDKRNNTTRSCL